MVDNFKDQRENDTNMSASVSQYQKYGFNVSDIGTFPPKYKCSFCTLIIQEPLQLTECGHRVCRKCYEVRAITEDNGRVKCPDQDCSDFADKDQIMPDKAFRRELDNLQVTCLYKENNICLWCGLLKDYQAHLDATHIHYSCSECNLSFSSQAVLDDHMTKCPVVFQRCPLAPFCTEDMIRKTDFEKHCLSERHQETLAKGLIGDYNLSETISPEQEIEINARNKELEEQSSEKLNNLSNELQKLKDGTMELSESFSKYKEHIYRTAQELNNCHLLMNERHSTKQSLQPNQEKLQQDLEKLQLAYDSSQHISSDGTLTWRIDHVAEKMADAQSERQTSIFSPVFYSSPTGYKMRVRLFLFGDGNARRTHISLFFLLMKGEFDAILKWPFHYKVTFCLLDQMGSNRHIIDSFYPDVKSNSFQRPKEAANTASGIPKFFPLTMLLQDDNVYVREDTLYLKIIIGLNDMPKALLPYVLTLNPALPNYVQENLIIQETGKLQKQQQQVTVNNPQTMPMSTGK
ncbi:hypothetical protein I4U23_012619 [Adineta vaga]|nr:hypothetical protein I4U23_012619 [Adineta vaga]